MSAGTCSVRAMELSATPTAIDLYAGIGGWALGLKFSGVELLGSYEWWREAAATHRANLRGPVHEVDIRSLDVSLLPDTVDFVVGSPPCTEFSFSNRGGQGDIADGLKDIEKFLEVVRRLRPRAWAMENVPRVAGILERELASDGALSRFNDLVPVIQVVDAADWGVPQSRKRMIAGNFDFQLLEAYKSVWPMRTLGEVVEALAAGITDPVFGWPVGDLTDNLPEPPLDAEEERLNRESKTFHRVYNKMSFPDRTDRPARTVTALCTRVSRESIVIGAPGNYRRLSIRERASLQSFPVAYQLQGDSYTSRLKMVGNAIPPLLAFNVVQALKGTPVQELALPVVTPKLATPVASILPVTPTKKFQAKRRFASAIPGLRFGSGVRFELSNACDAGRAVEWRVAFYHGSSKDVRCVSMDDELSAWSSCRAIASWIESVSTATAERCAKLPDDPIKLQETWIRKTPGDGPFEVLDALGELAGRALAELNDLNVDTAEIWSTLAGPLAIAPSGTPRGANRKLARFASPILAGLAVGSAFNRGSALAGGSSADSQRVLAPQRL